MNLHARSLKKKNEIQDVSGGDGGIAYWGANLRTNMCKAN